MVCWDGALENMNGTGVKPRGHAPRRGQRESVMAINGIISEALSQQMVRLRLREGYRFFIYNRLAIISRT